LLLISVVVVLFVLFILYSHFQRSSLIGLFKTEQAHSRQVFNTILDMQSRLARVAAQDYTAWDDMAAYVVSGDNTWAQANLDSTLDTFKIDGFWVYRIDGTLLYSRNSRGDGRLASLAVDPRQILKKGGIERFFIKTPAGLCEIFAATVHPTEDTKRLTPPAGYFLVARLWDEQFLDELSELVGGVVALVDPGQGASPPLSGGSYEEGNVVTRTPLMSWDGKPVALIEVSTKFHMLRDFNEQFKRYIFLFFVIGLLFVSFVFFLLFRWFTRPLRLISWALEKEDVRYLGVFEKSRDEFGAISKLINNFFWQREQLLREIKERSLAEEKILRAAREWRTTFDCISEQVSVMDKEYRIVRVNQAFAERFNMRVDQIAGKVCYELLGRDKPCPRCPHRRAMKVKTTCMAEYFAGESGIYSEVTCSPIFDDTGVFIGSVHIVKDITARKDMEKKQRLAQLGKLVADMAHEVNNPLMIISGRGQLSLMEDIQSPELKENLKIIVDECQRAKEIIQRLLKFAKPSIKDMRLVDIQTCIDTVINLIEHQFSVAGITFIRRYLEKPPFVLIDDRQMQEVFMNLFNNAREAMPNVGTITVTVSKADGRLKIEIKDTGSGMSPDVKKRLFEPFFTTKDRGTGLGLAVCYGIIKSYGGSLGFESEPGAGTAAVITFPITQEQSIK